MAVFAFGVGFDVGFGFASCHLFIVAGKATIDDWRVINVDFCPGNLIVALAALGIGAGMGGWLALGHIVVVAAGTVGGHAFEYCANVARFAGHILVRALQRKTRLAMIEVLVDFCEAIGGLGKRGRNDKREHDRKQSNHNLQL